MTTKPLDSDSVWADIEEFLVEPSMRKAATSLVETLFAMRPRGQGIIVNINSVFIPVVYEESSFVRCDTRQRAEILILTVPSRLQSR